MLHNALSSLSCSTLHAHYQKCSLKNKLGAIYIFKMSYLPVMIELKVQGVRLFLGIVRAGFYEKSS